MLKISRVAQVAATMTLVTLAQPRVALAAQTTMTISMTAPPAVPRIQPPFTVGAHPGAPFLYAIPATGQSPLSFSAGGLPAGLALDASSGTISGTAPAAGAYDVSIGVTNGGGSATQTLTILSGSSLRPTPPLGWNSYDAFGASITESEVVEQAQALKSTLQPFGWNYVVIDYRWYDPQDTLDANGRYLPATSKYPSARGSNGFKSLAAQIHALGLGFGIHIMRGIPRSAVSANSPIANATYHAADAGNTSDPCPWDTHMWGVHGDTAAGQAWYDALFAQYAAWGIDFVKIDDMLNNSTKVYHQAEADAIRKAVDKTGRAIVVSFSPGPDDPSWLPASVGSLNSDADMWRVVDDFWDYSAITDLPGVFRSAGTWQAAAGLAAGHWPDADMLPLGYLGPRCEWHASGETTFDHNTQVTILSLWSILPSPLIFGGNVQSLTSDATTGPWTTALLTNEEVLAVNQDASGAHATRVTQQGNTEVWARDLSGGRKAVALFNRNTQDASVSVTFAQLGVSGAPTVRDLWHRADVGGMTTGITTTVPYGGALLYMLSPAGSSGAGGTAGGGGVSGGGVAGSGGAGSGGAAGSGVGGVAGASGANGGSGAGATSGSSSGGMNGSAGAGAGGVVGTGGTAGVPSGSGGAAGGVGGTAGGVGGTAGVPNGGASTGGSTGLPPNATASNPSGCSCRLAATSDSDARALLLLLGLVGFARARRRLV
ncbi:MAG TPA: putative Ig domain-containing protein [Polyangiaceae bacterium]